MEMHEDLTRTGGQQDKQHVVIPHDCMIEKALAPPLEQQTSGETTENTRTALLKRTLNMHSTV